MQATVATYDAATRSGTVLLDDGTRLPFDSAAFEAGGLRGARFGQRVTINVIGTGRDRAVSALTLSTFAPPTN